MGRTYRHDKEWGKRHKSKKSKRVSNQKPLNKNTSKDENDEEYLPKKYFKNPTRGV